MGLKRIYELKDSDIKSAIIILGAGVYGEYSYRYCKNNFPGVQIEFCDNDIEKQRNGFFGHKVFTLDRLIKKYADGQYILSSSLYANEMKSQLVRAGIKENQIFVLRKDDCTGLSMDDKWNINRIVYYRKTGRKIHKDCLNTFTEKMQYSKIYLADGMRSRLTDKYLVRQFVKEKIGEEYLIPLLGVYKSFDTIDFRDMPKAFVLKVNHGCDMNHIIIDKDEMDIFQMRSDFHKWLNTDFSEQSFELHYHDIEPCIVVERYIGGFSGKGTFDYKFFCFDGIVRMIMIVKDMRQKGSTRCFYDADFNFISCELNDGVPMPDTPFERPECLSEMIKIAEALSEGIDQVRVDLYAPEGKIYFGEMTFTSWSGLVDMQPEEVDRWLGSYWNMRRPG